MANLVLKNNTSGGKTSVTADNFVGNASTASKWLTARTLTLSGDVSGSASFDGSGNISLTTVVADSSHNHAASNITSGTISIDRLPTITVAKGGTGATTAAAARTNLGVPSTTGTGATGTWSIGISGNAATSNSLKAHTTLTSSTVDSFLETSTLKWACADASVTGNDGVIMSLGWSTNYGVQIWFDDGSAEGGMKFRNRKDGSTWNPWRQTLTENNYTSYCAPASHSHSYVPLSGGTMTGKLQVNHTIFGYQYTNSNNKAAFMWDKPGSNYTGVGACAQTDMIHFGPCDANANWVGNYNQIWRFQGGVYATGWLETDNCGTGAPGSSTPGYGRVGALYFKY